MSEWHELSWTFVGGGNMAEALLRGALPEGGPAVRFRVVDPSDERRTVLADALGIETVEQVASWEGTDAMVLAVKPQVLDEVLRALPAWSEPLLVVSVAAGVSADHIAACLPGPARVVRAMPNTPALVGSGAAGVAPGPGATADDLHAALGLLGQSGFVVEVTEEQLHAVTALSGSGPAYFFRLVECMTEAGVSMGLSEEVAGRLAVATCAGAGDLLEHTRLPAAELRRRVTSPGGTTQAALASFEAQGLDRVVAKAMDEATRRSRELMEGEG